MYADRAHASDSAKALSITVSARVSYYGQGRTILESTFRLEKILRPYMHINAKPDCVTWAYSVRYAADTLSVLQGQIIRAQSKSGRTERKQREQTMCQSVVNGPSIIIHTHTLFCH